MPPALMDERFTGAAASLGSVQAASTKECFASAAAVTKQPEQAVGGLDIDMCNEISRSKTSRKTKVLAYARMKMLRSFSLMVRSLDNLKAKVVSSWCGQFGFWKFFHILCLSAFVLEFFSWRESEVNLLQCEHISNQASLQEKRMSSTSLPRRAESERLRLSCYRVPVRQMCKCNYIG